MILLDTNICICSINAKPPAVLARFRQYRLGDIGLSTRRFAHGSEQRIYRPLSIAILMLGSLPIICL